MAALLALALCASYFLSVRKTKISLKLAPLALRLCAVALILWCLCAPTKVLERKSDPKTDKPKIALVLDNSSSMLLKGLKGDSRLDGAVAEAKALLKASAADFDFDVFSFSSALKPESSLDAVATQIEPTLRPTALHRCLAEWSRRESSKYRASVWFTDGVDTASPGGLEQAADALAASASPVVFAVASEPLKSRQSVEMERVEAPACVKAGADAQITIVVRCSGLDPALPFELKTTKGEKTVASAKLESFSRGTFTKAVSFQVPIKTPGVHSFESALLVDGRQEASVKWSVTGTERKRLKALLWTGSLDWGVRFLRRAFEGSENMELDIRYAPDFLGAATGVPPKNDKPPLASDEIERYDLLILMDLRREQIAPDLEARLRDYLESGGALLFIVPNAETGEAYASSTLERLLPVEFEKVSGSEAESLDPKAKQFVERMRRYREGLMMEKGARVRPGAMELPPLQRMELTEEGASCGIFDYAKAASGVRQEAIPVFEEFALAKGPKPGAELLAVHPSFKDQAGGGRALLAVQRFGFGRSALLATDPLWRWRMTLSSKSSDFESFWTHLAAWLCAGKESSPAWLLNSLVLESGKPAKVAFSLPPRTLKFKDLEFSVECAGEVKPLEMKEAGRPGVFEGEVSPRAGRTSVLRAKKGSEPVASASFCGGPAPEARELETLRPDVSGLRRLAAACDGVFAERLSDVDFKRFLPAQAEPVSLREESPLWDKAFVLIALLLILCAELVARRAVKMA